MQCKVICITGGIGSGKTVVCTILQALGYHVYICDLRAKYIMDNSDRVKHRIYSEISPDAIEFNSQKGWGAIKRGVLSEIVFNSKKDLDRLNEITHGEVRSDIKNWYNRHTDDKLVFIETAIPYTSGIDQMSYMIWEIQAPLEMRIKRAVLRDDSTREKVIARIDAQAVEMSHLRNEYHGKIHVLTNDDICPLLRQVLNLLHSCLTD